MSTIIIADNVVTKTTDEINAKLKLLSSDISSKTEKLSTENSNRTLPIDGNTKIYRIEQYHNRYHSAAGWALVIAIYLIIFSFYLTSALISINLSSKTGLYYK
eukprot:Pgem_evm1s4527